MSVARMHPADLERLADLVADRLATRVPATALAGQLGDVKQLAAALGVTSSFVYDHAVELGGAKLGDGPKARWRFDIHRAREAMASTIPAQVRPAPLPRRSRAKPSVAGGVPLLPIKPKSS